jgi:hypothetical protein
MQPDWSLSDIPFDSIDVAAVHPREDLFYLVTSASFVEIASDLYTQNLAAFYAGDDEVCAWLNEVWEREEVQHGHALRAYVNAVWPEFDWQTAFDSFIEEYSSLCDLGHFEPTRGLEMAARCVIEMGTAGLYRALGIAAREPVLAQLSERIKTDEVGHFKYFLRFFEHYNQEERQSRWKILKALTHRLFETRGDDAECALWHAFRMRNPGKARDSKEFRTVFSTATRTIRAEFPSMMAIKMLTRPLGLPTIVSRGIEWPLAQIAQRVILR